MVWLDGSDGDTVTADGDGKVSEWLSKGRSPYPFLQAIDSRKPEWGDATQNGLYVMDFVSASLQANDTPAGEFADLHQGPASGLVVWRIPGNATAFDNCGNASLSNGFVFQRTGHSSTSGQGRHWARSSDADIINASAGNYVPVDQWHVFHFLFDPENAVAAERSRIFINGANEISNNTYAGDWTTANPTSHPKLMGSSNNVNNNQTGRMAELVLDDRLWSEAELEAAIEALAEKWGITLP